jgi:hypothetical protein
LPPPTIHSDAGVLGGLGHLLVEQADAMKDVMG